MDLIAQWGRFEIRLCPLSADSEEAEKAELSDDCLSQHHLTLADGSGPYYYMKVGRRIHELLTTGGWMHRLTAALTHADTLT